MGSIGSDGWNTARGARIEVQVNSVLLVRTLNQERGKNSVQLSSWQSPLVTLCQWYRVLFLSPKRRGNDSKHLNFF